MGFAIGLFVGAVAVVSVPVVNDYAVRLRDFLYGLITEFKG